MRNVFSCKREVLKIYKYLEDSNGENWKLDKEKIKKLLIGDLKELLRAMDYIGPITSKRLKDKFGEFYKKISNRGPLYEKHSDYIRNILQAKQIYTEEYLEQLVKNFPSAFDSMDDLKNMVYFNYLDEKDWGKRILAKLTHDLEADNP